MLIIPPIIFGGMIPSALALTPDDTFYAKQWYLLQIQAEKAWDITTGSPDVIVAVVDTAMDIDHEDLKENIWTNTRETFGNSVDDDGNGFADDIHGWNFLDRSNDVRPRDGAGTEHGRVHATLVASLIAARGNNGVGIAGVAWRIKIMPVVALDADGGGSTGDVANAIYYAVNNGADIINLSLEGYQDAPDVDAAIAHARSMGVLTVAAAGNAEEVAGVDVDMQRVFPVCLSTDTSFGLIGVGSTDRADRRAAFANYGSCIQVSAPGDDVFGAQPTDPSTGAGYGSGFSGTSLAAPLVAGTAALIKSLRPDWGWAELRERIMSTAAPVDHLQDDAYRGRIGRGRLDMAAAVTGLVGMPPPQEPQTLSATIPGRDTRVRVRTATVSSMVDVAPYGMKDQRGARAAFADVDGDGSAEIVVVPASGRAGTWVVLSADGTERMRGNVATDLREGLIVTATSGGFVLADPRGGRAWGVDAKGVVTPFYPYGTGYRAGLDMVSLLGKGSSVDEWHLRRVVEADI